MRKICGGKLMNQEQLNAVVDTYNESRYSLMKDGSISIHEDPMEEALTIFFSLMSCYLCVYKDLFPDKYETAKNVLQNMADMFTLGLDIETSKPKEGEFSMETQHLVYVGNYENTGD